MVKRTDVPANVKREMARMRRETAEARQRPAGDSSPAPPEPTPETEAVTLAEAAEMAAGFGFHHLTKRWFNRQLDRKRFPYHVVGHRRMMRRDVVKAILTSWHGSMGPLGA